MKQHGNNGVSPKLAAVSGAQPRDHGHSGILNDRKASKDEAIGLGTLGYSPNAIALHLGIPARVVRRWLRGAGIYEQTSLGWIRRNDRF